MDFLKNFKRLKKVNKRILLEENDTPEDKEVAVKNAVVSSLQTKTGNRRREISNSYDEFHTKYPTGFIPNDEYINSAQIQVKTRRINY